MFDLLLGDQVKKRGLPQLHRKPLPEGAVKHGITGGVHEFGKDD
jgi:hypothetical protein